MRRALLLLALLLALPGCTTYVTWSWTRDMNVAHLDRVRAWRAGEGTFEVAAEWSEGTDERVRWTPATQEVVTLDPDAALPSGPEVGPDAVRLAPFDRVLHGDEVELFGLHRPEGCKGDVVFGLLVPFAMIVDIATFPVSIPLAIFFAGQSAIRG